ncbi:hypothetical protein KIN20_011544 [Parelaphostrongylus tenuis]|uniref:Uncharacterized protein n=1 Tax=Parelaphostrongylus tenuis TaxID=148309 RepID=A0AAD5MTR8_PARTN|nr:hypothetical protein KIN20_011544 [Parelaphostrongylus tenuis]
MTITVQELITLLGEDIRSTMQAGNFGFVVSRNFEKSQNANTSNIKRGMVEESRTATGNLPWNKQCERLPDLSSAITTESEGNKKNNIKATNALPEELKRITKEAKENTKLFELPQVLRSLASILRRGYHFIVSLDPSSGARHALCWVWKE